jgi:hypothetical protein
MLPADEVRQIGQQVADSPYAREIVDRIQRVTRQRRLTAPAQTGPEGADANVVAEYLDNGLSSDQVIEFEKKCLTSDLHLAEVASVHQILSLLGNKAKVPNEARYRMYHLVKGRETLPSRPIRSKTENASQPVAAALPEWNGPAALATRPRDLLRPLSALAALLLLLAWSTWVNLQPVPKQSPLLEITTKQSVGPVVANLPARQRLPVAREVPRDIPGGDMNEDPNEAGNLAVTPNEEEPAPGDGELAAMNPNEAKAAAADPSRSRSRIGGRRSVATVSGGGGVLLLKSEPDAPWQRTQVDSTIDSGGYLVNLAPLSSELAIGPLSLRLEGTTIVRLGEQAQDATASIEVVEGRLVLNANQDDTEAFFLIGPERLALELPRDVKVGIEHAREWIPGTDPLEKNRLTLLLPEAQLVVRLRSKTETISGPARIEIDSEGTLSTKAITDIPLWVKEASASLVEQELGRQFARFFRPEVPPLTNLVEAATSDQPELQALAFEGLAAIDQLSIIVGALDAPNQPLTRRAAIASLRAAFARGEPTLSRLREELKAYGENADWAKLVENLLKGEDPDQHPDEQTLTGLALLLDHRDVAVRELALDNLMRVTKRGDSLGYDPDHPTPAGSKAWLDLLHSADDR